MMKVEFIEYKGRRYIDAAQMLSAIKDDQTDLGKALKDYLIVAMSKELK